MNVQMDDGFLVYLEFENKINYSHIQNNIPFIHSLKIQNHAGMDFEQVEIRITVEPGALEPLSTRYTKISSDDIIVIQNPRICFSPTYLKQLKEKELGIIRIEIFHDDTVLHQQIFEFEIYAFNEWCGITVLPEILAAFSMPNQQAIATILQYSRMHLKSLEGRTAFSGYQMQSHSYVKNVCHAIYLGLCDLKISYINPPASFEKTGQKVRFPDEILEHTMGTCLDLTLLFCSCLEQVGLYPLVIIIEGHSFVGLHLSPMSFNDCVIEEPARLRNRVDSGEMLAFETTGITQDDTPLPFESACNVGRSYLDANEKFLFAIDIKTARNRQIYPISIVSKSEIQNQPTLDENTKPVEANLIEHNETISVIEESQEELDHLSSPIIDDLKQVQPMDVPSRIKRWKEKLLDMTMRNRLLNFKETKKTVGLLKSDLHALEDALAAGQSFELLPNERLPYVNDSREASLSLTSSGTDPLQDFLSKEFSHQNLYTKLNKENLEKNLIEISREYKSNMQEGGANTLFLTMGFLSWYETEISQDQKRAPIILLPLMIQRKSINAPFKISLLEEEPRINITLLKKLEMDFGIKIDSLDPLPQDDSGLDLVKIFNTIRKKIDHQERWEIIEDAYIGHFSFAKYLLWYELENHLDKLLENQVIGHLIDRTKGQYHDGIAYPNQNTIDEDYTPKDIFCVTDADSSQMAAILAAANGKSFVLQGPPGTGKSQTITNLISHCIANDKRVLFVSAKMAALNVVHDRLAKANLGPFCLELHSNKNSVRYMLDQCRESFEAKSHGDSQAEHDWLNHAESLQSLRDDLNDYATLLRSPQPFEQKTFQVYSKAIGYSKFPTINPQWDNPDLIDYDFYRQSFDKIQKLETISKTLDSIKNNPWRGCTITTWSFDIERNLQVLFDQTHESVNSSVRYLQECANQFLINNNNWVLEQYRSFTAFAEILLNAGTYNKKMLQNPQWNQQKEKLYELAKIGTERDQIKAIISQDLNESIYEIDIKPIRNLYSQAVNAGFFGFFWYGWKAAATIKPYQQPQAKHSKQEWIKILDQVQQVQNLNQDLTSLQTEVKENLDDGWNHQNTNWQLFEEQLKLTEQFLHTLSVFQSDDIEKNIKRKDRWILLATDGRDQVQDSAPLSNSLKQLLEHSHTLNNQLEELSKILLFDPESIWNQSNSIGYLESLLVTIEQWKRNLSNLRAWTFFNEACNQVTEAGFGELVQKLLSGEHDIDSLQNVFNHSFYRWGAEYVFEKEDRIKNFQSAEHSRKIERFRDYDQQIQHKTKDYIAQQLSFKIPNIDKVNNESEPGKLKKYIEQKRPRVSIRKLIHESSQTLTRIKPCFLMSPLSIAQYLDFDFPAFDLVVFDEASQLPVWDAVSALSRAKQAIVVGDSKQLPPTNFFTRSNHDDNDEDEDVIVEQESLLDEFTVNFPSESLKVHYRSRHEDLITFSNRKYYKNKLITFPTAIATHPTMGVTLRYIKDGIYDRGNSRTNRREADEIIDEIVKRLSDPELQQHSIGVVTLNSTQQTLIEDLLDKARRDHPEIEEFFSDDYPEPVIVKNIENVQGDERDIILLSITYGPDEQGRFFQSFGPIAQSGGERRLNVAVTRARRQVIVFSSIKSDKIKPGGEQGRQDLKAYLDYADRGPIAIPSQAIYSDGNETESAFEKHVLECLTNKGWKVHPQVGCSGYRIDLGVLHPENKNQYILGIECDGAMYHSNRVARERDRIRSAVLKNLGWDLHRIWSTDWWLNSERELQKIEKHLQENLKKPTYENTPQHFTKPEKPTEKIAAQYSGKPTIELTPKQDSFAGQCEYTTYPSTGVNRTSDFYDEKTKSEIKGIIQQIMKYEEPVELERLIELIRREWGISRAGNKIREQIQLCLNDLDVTIQKDRNAEHVWTNEPDESIYKKFRVPPKNNSYKRSISKIPTYEIVNASKTILNENLSLPIDSIIVEITNIFGYQRSNDTIKQEIKLILEQSSKEHNWKIENDVISLLES